MIAAAAANAEKLPKGQKWDEGLINPGTLDVTKFPCSDAKLGVVFEDEEMVRLRLHMCRSRGQGH